MPHRVHAMLWLAIAMSVAGFESRGSIVARSGQKGSSKLLHIGGDKSASAQGEARARAGPLLMKHKVESIVGEVIVGEHEEGIPLWQYYGVPNQNKWDLIVDVRSPSEFAEDAIPGSVNHPLLSDSERAEVGTAYCRKSRFDGRLLGARYVAANLARIIEQLSDIPRDARILVYCWRGGERSNTVTYALSKIGWHVAQLEGGYKAYRAAVRDQLYNVNSTLLKSVAFHRIDGPTGCGKGAVLNELSHVLDLESLAQHRGSALGDMFAQEDIVPQPSQKKFESALYSTLSRFQGSYCFVEAESARIGRLQIPSALCAKLVRPELGATRLDVPLDARIARIRHMYRLFETPRGSQILARKLKLRLRAPRTWLDLIEERDWDALVRTLLVEHYDPAYEKAQKRDQSAYEASEVRTSILRLNDLQPDTVRGAARHLGDLIARNFSTVVTELQTTGCCSS